MPCGQWKPKGVIKPTAFPHTKREKSKDQQGAPACASQRPEQAPIQGSRDAKAIQEACQENSDQASCRHVQRAWKSRQLGAEPLFCNNQQGVGRWASYASQAQHGTLSSANSQQGAQADIHWKRTKAVQSFPSPVSTA